MKRIIRRNVGIIAIGILITTTTLISGCVESKADEVTCDTEEVLRKVERLIMPLGMTDGVQIRLGGLPDSFPEDVPVPGDSELIGSIVYPLTEQYDYVMAVFDSEHNLEKAMDQYREKLTQSGFTEFDERVEEHGFSTGIAADVTTFCKREPEAYSLEVMGIGVTEQPGCSIRLMLSTEPDPGRCEYEERDRSFEIGTLLPQLIPPEDSTPLGGERGGSSDRRYSNLKLKTGSSLGELHRHYRDQLEEEGWNLEEQGGSTSVAFSSWSFTDEYNSDWSGILIVRRLKGEMHHLMLQADLVQPGEDAPQLHRGWGEVTEMVTTPAEVTQEPTPLPTITPEASNE